jgi:hypothetical protein
MSNIESNLKKLLKGEKACVPEHFLKVPSYNSPTLRTGKGKPLSEGAFGKMYRGSINDNGRRYVAYKEIDTSESTDGAFEFEFKVAEKLKEFAVPEMYLFKKCPIQDKTPKRVRKKNGTLVQPKERTKPKDILYMELLNGTSFNSWWQTNPSLDAIKSVIVQVFDNLYRINQKFPDFRHRDLHGNNVMVNPDALKTPYTWEVDLGRKVIRNDPGGSFRSRLGSPDIKKYKRTNAGVEATIIDFGLSYWSDRMPNPETVSGGYTGAGIHGKFPGTIRYDTHRFLYIIYAKVRQPQNSKERAIKNFIEELVPNKRYFDFNGPFTSQGYLVNDAWDMQNLPSFKTILSHPFLTGEKMPNRPKTLAEALEMIAPKPKPKPKTPVKVKTPKAKTKTPSPKLSTTERKKKRNSAIKRAAAVLAKPKTKPAPRRRPGVVRPNPVPEIQPASPSPKANAPYGVMSPSNMLEYVRKIESGRKKAANKLNARVKEIKATKGKTPTPVRLKQRYTFTDIKGKKREFVRKFAYDRALAKNKAEREKTPTPKAKKNEYWRSFVDVNGKKQEFESKSAYHEAKQKNLQAYGAKMQAKINRQIQLGRDARFSFVDVNGKKREYVRKGMYEKALAKNKAEREKRARAKTPTPKKAVNMYINKFVNKLDKDEVNALKKKICQP